MNSFVCTPLADLMSGLEFPKAVVVGGTGAVGSQVINHLLKCKRWSRVVAIGRRPAVAQEGLPEEVKARLEQVRLTRAEMLLFWGDWKSKVKAVVQCINFCIT